MSDFFQYESESGAYAKKILVIPNITNSGNIEADSFVDVLCNHINKLKKYNNYFWHVLVPKNNTVRKLNLPNVLQHEVLISGDMIKMRTYCPDLNNLLETLDYDVIYSHLPDWPQIGRYKKSFETKIVGYCHWWELKTSNAEDRKNKWRWLPVELLGVSQMSVCYLNTQDQKNRVLKEASELFNDNFVSKLDTILKVWNLGVPKEKILKEPVSEKENVIVFNHRAAAYKGFPKFLELMAEYRDIRQDFTVWVPQLKENPPFLWIDNQKFPKHEYYKKLQRCKVGVQMRQSNYGWSVSATDCLMNGTPMIYQDSLCYREIEPDGLFFKKKSDFFKLLDSILDDASFRKDREIKSIKRSNELFENEEKMIEDLNSNLF